ncbi:MAG: amino acid ABC transporter substrate-binding protein [Casimicrobium sp.]
MTPLFRFFCFSLTVALSASAFAGATLDRIRQTGTINIGFRASAVPFSFTADDGKSAQGYSIEICDLLTDAIKQELKLRSVQTKFVPVTSAERFNAVNDGKIDLECANTTNTKARREFASFSMPHFFAAARLLVRDGARVNVLDDLVGKTLVVVKSTTGATIAERYKGRINILVAENNAVAVKMVEDKSADAFITDDILLHAFKAQSKEKLAVVGPNMSVEPLAIMFSKSDSELQKLIEREMAKLYTSGKLRSVYRKWFQAPIPQRGFTLDAAPNILHADMFSRPSGYTVDWVVL